jgi:hypothetical protein
MGQAERPTCPRMRGVFNPGAASRRQRTSHASMLGLRASRSPKVRRCAWLAFERVTATKGLSTNCSASNYGNHQGLCWAFACREDFEGYDRVCPGAARDIMNMAMHQEHRNHMEKYEAHSEFWLPVIGMGAAFLTIGACLLAGVVLAFTGHTNEAISVLSGTLALTVIGAYLQRGNRPKRMFRHRSRLERGRLRDAKNARERP